MQVDPRAIFGMLGVDAGKVFPVVTDCPLCNARLKLEVRSAHHITCRSCWFVGDLIQLYARATQHTVPAAVAKLKALSFVGDLNAGYATAVASQASWAAFCAKQVEYMRQQVPPVMMGIIYGLGIRPPEQAIQQAMPHFFYTTRKAIETARLPLPPEAAPVLSWWRRYGAIAIPSYDGACLCGLWLITSIGESYLPIEVSRPSAGFSLAASIFDPAAVIVDTASDALRLSLWSLLSTGALYPFIIPHGMRDNVDGYRARQVVYWTPSGNSAWYLRAMTTPGAKTLPHYQVQYDEHTLPARGSLAAFLKSFSSMCRSAHAAAAEHLLALPEQEARALLVNHPLEPCERAKCVASVSGEDANRLSSLIMTANTSQTVAWNGEIVSETADGWICKGKVVSSATLQLFELRPMGKTGDAEVTGSVSYQGKAYTFTARLSDITKNPGSWMQRLVVSMAGRVPFVDRGWTHRIFELAQQFHPPTPVLSNQLYGWQDAALRMPRFIADRNGVFPAETQIRGPVLDLPEPLSCCDYDTFKSPGFCRLYLALLGNIALTFAKAPAMGLVLTNEPQVLTRLASGLGTELTLNPTATAVAAAAHDPLPLITNWTPEKLAEALAPGHPLNIAFSTDRKTAQLLRLHPGWLHVRVGGLFDSRVLRAIFLVVPRVIADPPIPTQPGFYAQLAELAIQGLDEHLPARIIRQAGRDLDLHLQYTADSEASRVMELLVYAVTQQQVSAATTDTEVVIRHQDVVDAMVTPVVKLPPLPDLTRALMDARYLTESTVRGRWSIARNVWDLYRSLSTARV
jgi:hypothetical protein